VDGLANILEAPSVGAHQGDSLARVVSCAGRFQCLVVDNARKRAVGDQDKAVEAVFIYACRYLMDRAINICIEQTEASDTKGPPDMVERTARPV